MNPEHNEDIHFFFINRAEISLVMKNNEENAF